MAKILSMPKVRDDDVFRVDIDNMPGDMLLIEDCAEHIRRQIASLNAVERWVACGKRLTELHTELKRPSSRANSARIGWHEAFKLDPCPFPFSRMTAQRLIVIYQGMVARCRATKNLPSSIEALYLALIKLSPEQLDAHLAAGTITPTSSPREIAALIKGLPKSEPVTRDSPKTDRVLYVRDKLDRLLDRMNLKFEDVA